jgi:hypothetical protein
MDETKKWQSDLIKMLQVDSIKKTAFIIHTRSTELRKAANITSPIFCGKVSTVVSSFQYTVGASSRKRIPRTTRDSYEPSYHSIDHVVRIRERQPHLLPPQQKREYCRRLMSLCRSVTSSSDTRMDEADADAGEVSSHKVLSKKVVVPPQQQQQLHLSQYPPKKRHNKNRLAVLRQWIRRTMISISLTTTLIISRPFGSSAATTTTTIATAVSSSKQSPSAVSIRPGMSKTQVDALEKGDVSVVEQLQKSTKPSDPIPSRKSREKCLANTVIPVTKASDDCSWMVIGFHLP